MQFFGTKENLSNNSLNSLNIIKTYENTINLNQKSLTSTENFNPSKKNSNEDTSDLSKQNNIKKKAQKLREDSSPSSIFVINPSLKVNELFLLWLNLQDTQHQIDGLLNQTEKEPSKKGSEIIPTFYVPLAKRQKNNEIIEKEQKLLKRSWKVLQLDQKQNEPPPLPKFITFLKKTAHFPSFISSLLWNKLQSTQKDFFSYWDQHLLQLDEDARFFEIIRTNQKNITSEDLYLLMKEIVNSHKALDFLRNTPEFQERYQETLVVSILHSCSRSKRGELTLKEFKQSKLTEMFSVLDDQTDATRFPEFFNYEQFYAIYRKFWELDEDHDLLIDFNDLMRYGNGCLTNRIIDRILKQPKYPPKLSQFQTPKEAMTFKDFVWFFLSEENKQKESSIEYWFRCLDVDGDGVLSSFEMEFFLDEQRRRLINSQIHFSLFLSHKDSCHHKNNKIENENLIGLIDNEDDISNPCDCFFECDGIIGQLLDAIHPNDPGKITAHDIKKSKQSSYFFNCLFNSQKFINQEIDPLLGAPLAQNQQIPQYQSPSLVSTSRYCFDTPCSPLKSKPFDTDLFDVNISDSSDSN